MLPSFSDHESQCELKSNGIVLKMGFVIPLKTIFSKSWIFLIRQSLVQVDSAPTSFLPQAAQAHYVWVRASEVIWSEYTRIISVLSDAK